MSKDTLNNQISGSQLGNISEHQTFNQIGGKQGSQSFNKNIESYSDKNKGLVGKSDQMKEQLFERAGKNKSETTLSAARIELNGGQISKAFETGFTYDHVQKVMQAQKGLRRHIEAINARLSWVDLPKTEIPVLQKELSKASKLLDLSKTYVP